MYVLIIHTTLSVQFAATAPPPYIASPTSQEKYEPVPYVVAQTGLPPKLYPHSFLIFSILVSILCGIFNILSLLCSLPAVTLSILVSSLDTCVLYIQNMHIEFYFFSVFFFIKKGTILSWEDLRQCCSWVVNWYNSVWIGVCLYRSTT